jgi:hypothetical protein
VGTFQWLAVTPFIDLRYPFYCRGIGGCFFYKFCFYNHSAILCSIKLAYFGLKMAESVLFKLGQHNNFRANKNYCEPISDELSQKLTNFFAKLADFHPNCCNVSKGQIWSNKKYCGYLCIFSTKISFLCFSLSVRIAEFRFGTDEFALTIHIDAISAKSAPKNAY